MNAAPGEVQEWMSLGTAARRLGITPATLRRWADAGAVPAFTTPGGHRRFSRATVEAMIRRRPVAVDADQLGMTMAAVLDAYRRRAAPPASWADALDPAQREELRRRGRRLVAALLRGLGGTAADVRAAEEEAVVEASAYGAAAAEQGASVAEAVQAFLEFRSPFLQELARQATRHLLPAAEATGLLMRAEASLDRVLIAIVQGLAER